MAPVKSHFLQRVIYKDTLEMEFCLEPVKRSKRESCATPEISSKASGTGSAPCTYLKEMSIKDIFVLA